MRKKNWTGCVLSAALAFLLSVGGLVCLLTAYDLQASISTVLWWCMLWSVAFSIGYLLEWQLLPVGILAVITGYIWHRGVLTESIGGLMHQLTQVYSQVHGWPVLGQEATVDIALCSMGTLTAFSVSRSVCGGKNCFWAVVFSAVPVVLCFPVADAAPQPLWLGIWIFGMSLLLLTRPAQTDSNSNRLTVCLAVPAAVLAVALLLMLPQSAQEKPRALAESVTSFLEELGIGAAPGRSLKTDGGAVELNKLGSRKESTGLVMTVTADRGGRLYLRGCGYDTYFRNNWTNLALRDNMYWPDASLLKPAGQVKVQTEYVMQMRYFPYYADGVTNSVDRGINNYGSVKEYSYQIGILEQLPETYTDRPEDGYTQLPTVTKRWADEVLQELITEDMTDSEKIAAITDYVRSCARYSLYVDKMPASEQDFAAWFAQSAGKGYCVHFATTAAVLLRAAGLPARYVTGYMVQAQSGEPTEVYGKDAHAWVECFVEGVGWIPVEATPGADRTEAPATEKTPAKQAEFSAWPLLWGCGALVVLTLTGVAAQWAVRVMLRRRKRKKGTPRQRFLEGYRQLTQLLEQLRRQPARELEEQAEQAMFSNHPVEPEALEQLENAIRRAKKQLKKQPLFKRLHMRLILALY